MGYCKSCFIQYIISKSMDINRFQSQDCQCEWSAKSNLAFNFRLERRPQKLTDIFFIVPCTKTGMLANYVKMKK